MYTTILSILFVCLILALIYGIYFLSINNENKRSKVLADWAASRNWIFYRYPSEFIQLFECIQQVGGGDFLNIIDGDIDKRKIRAFDGHKVEGGSGYKVEQSYSSVALDTGLPLKPLFIRTEKFVDTMTDFLGFNDIDFDSAEFSTQFYVKAKDTKWAYDVLSQEMVEFLIRSPRFNIELHDRTIIAYRHKFFEIEDFEDAIKMVTGILDRLPSSLMQELKEADSNRNGSLQTEQEECLEKAYSYKERNMFQDALREADAAILLDASLAEAHNLRGISLEEMGRDSEAIEAYRKAIDLNPDFREAKNNLNDLEAHIHVEQAYKYKEENKFEDVLREADAAITSDPLTAEAYNLRGIALEELGRKTEAIETYRKAIDLNPRFREAKSNLADLIERH